MNFVDDIKKKNNELINSFEESLEKLRISFFHTYYLFLDLAEDLSCQPEIENVTITKRSYSHIITIKTLTNFQRYQINNPIQPTTLNKYCDIQNNLIALDIQLIKLGKAMKSYSNINPDIGKELIFINGELIITEQKIENNYILYNNYLFQRDMEEKKQKKQIKV